VHDTDPTQPVHDIKTLPDLIETSLASRRFLTDLLIFFALIALALAALGLYGLISYSVAQRTQEIGICMALGAKIAKVLAQVIGGGARLTLSGAVIGIAAVIPIVGLLGSALERGQARLDPWVLIATTAVLGAEALLGRLVPARRATRIDPMEALRFE
jgi:putative ABC transport system permease protein